MQVNISNYQGAMDTDVVSSILMATAPLSPIYSLLLGNGQVQSVDSEEFKWFGAGLGIESTLINSGALDETSTTLTVDSSAIFRPGDLVLAVATGEVMQVSAVPSGTTVTVARGIGSTDAAAGSVANDAVIQRISRAVGEGSDSPDATSAGKTEFSNYVQTFREPIEITGRVKRVKSKIEDERAFQRRLALLRFQRDAEQSIVHGVKSAHNNADGKRVTAMRGLREAIVSNVTAIGGTMSKSELYTFAAKVFATGSPVKTLIAGSTLVQSITELYDDKLRLSPADGTVGLKVQNVQTPHGLLQMIPHRGLVGAMAGDGIVVDPIQLKIRQTNGGEVTLKTDTEAKGKDASRDEYFAEFGLEYGNETDHGQITGVTGADLS